jgi:putative MATE family efflux protein
MVATGLLKSFYFLTDTYWVGHLGPEALAALGGSAFAWWITAQITDLPGTGIHSLVAQHEGAGEPERIPTTTSQGLWIALLVSVLLAGLAWPFCHLYFDLLGFDPAGLPYRLGTEYLGASLLGAGTLALFSVVGAAFRGIGDTRTGMWIAMLVGLLNLGLDPLLIWGAGPIPALGIAGAAWATAVSNLLGAAIGFAVLARRGLVLRWIRPQLPILRRIVKIGTPVAMAGIGFSLIYVLLGRIINSFGEHHMAALGVGHRLESLAFMVTVGFMVGASTMVGQYVGAGDPVGARKCARSAAVICSAIMLPVGLLLFFFAEPAFRFFTDDTAVIDAGVIYLRIQTPVMVFMALEIVYEGAFTGTGDTMPTFWVTGVGTAVRIPLALLLIYQLDFGVEGVWYAIAGTTFIKGLVMMAWFRRGRWERMIGRGSD